MEDDEFGGNPMDYEDGEIDEPVQEEKPKATPPKREEAEPKRRMESHVKIDSSNLDDYLAEINRLATILQQSQKSLIEIEKSFTIVNKLKALSELNVGRIEENFQNQLQNLDLGLYVKRAVEKEVEETMQVVRDTIEEEIMELAKNYKTQNKILKEVVNSDWVVKIISDANQQEKMTFGKKLTNFVKNGVIIILLICFGYGISIFKNGISEQMDEPKQEVQQGQKIKKVFPAGTSVLDTKTGQTKQASSDMNIEVVEMDEYYLYKNRYKFEKF
ncbi:MAG: hypothetical protein RBT59_12055 [Arcobacteraceae bacterium]|jgi:hypothetical protein|nr:hypothetical protein [Arcobacteraceae bacterium]